MAFYNQNEIEQINKSHKRLIIMFPFAGGNMYSYKDIIKYISPLYDVYCPEVPGRGDLSDISLLSNMEKMAQSIFISSIQYLNLDKEYILYGHSMGGLLVYLVAKLIKDNNINLPIKFIVSGREGPSSEKVRLTYNLPHFEFYNELKKIGGIPHDVINNKDLMEYFEPIIRSDFQAVETYKYKVSDYKFDIPIISLYGTEEDLSLDGLYKWQLETTRKVKFISMSGGHFFIFINAQKLAKIIESNWNDIYE